MSIKSKVHPIKDHEGGMGWGIRYSSTLSLTSQLDGGGEGGVSGMPHTPATLHLGKRPSTKHTGGSGS